MVLLLRRFFFCVLIISLPCATRAQQYVVDTLAANPNIACPVSIAFSPDNSGKFFFTEKSSGRVRISNQNGLAPRPFVTVPVKGSGEQGLLGLALHPEYPDSPFVYAFFTRPGDGWNVVVLYRDSAGVGVKPLPLLVIPCASSNHNGGSMHFGPDKKLYVTIGDDESPGNSQSTGAANLHGKILRLNPDGSIPPDNPWRGKPFWSIGLRNSSGFTFDQQTGIMYCTENGPGCNDEVNRVPAGGNLGWPSDFNQTTCAYLGNPEYVPPL